MRAVGLFEAKTKLSEICQQVLSTGEGVRITRRGKTVAVLCPPTEEMGSGSVWDARAQFEKEHGPFTDEFELPMRVVDQRTLGNPLE